jgi:UDP-2,3-diacylglucosamine hydrolase
MGAAAGPDPGPADAEAGRPRVLPSFFEFTAPAHWRAVDFLSDLHLTEDMPRTFAAWERHLRATTADAVFILGDLFELWVGDDARSQSFARRCVDVLAEASCHRTLAIMVGNRDFLIGTALLRDCGAIGLPDPSVLCSWGQRVLLTHGDALCLSDEPYMTFRREVRSPAWQRDFLAKPLAERLSIAREIRRASATRARFDGSMAVDIDAAEAVRWLHLQGATEMVHGHTHRPGSAAIAPGFKRHVLSDWDLDHDVSAPRAEVLRLTRAGFARLAPAGT